MALSMSPWNNSRCSVSVRWKRNRLTLVINFSLVVNSASTPALSISTPGFTKLACPSLLLLRSAGNTLARPSRPTAVCGRRRPCRCQKLNGPPAMFGLSEIASNPFAVSSSGSASPDA